MTRGGVALAVAAVLGLSALACDSREPEPEGAFYLKIEVETRPGATYAPYPPVPDRAGTVDVWFRDERHYRWESEISSPLLDWEPRWVVADGEDTTSFSPTTGQFYRAPINTNHLASSGVLPPNIGSPLGPIPGSVDDFVESWRGDDAMRTIGRDEVLGRDVEVFEYESSSGIGRLYIDRAAKFVLRHTHEGDFRSWDARVVELDVTPAAFAEELFASDLPAAAVPMPDTRDCHTVGPGGVFFPFPSGFIEFSYAPMPYEVGDNGAPVSRSCERFSAWAAVEDGDNYILVQEYLVPPTGAPDFVADLDEVEVAGYEGYRQTEGNIERLGWIQDGVIVIIETNAAPFEELLRIAQSGEVVP